MAAATAGSEDSMTPDYLNGTLCTIVAGNSTEGKTFRVHEALLRARSKFFEAALSKSWQENQEGVVRLPESTPDIVRRYLHHLYSGVLYIHEPPDHPNDGPMVKGFTMLARLYVFGEYVQDKAFKVCVLTSHITSMCVVDYDSIGEAIQWFPTETEVGIIYASTPAGSPMRHLMVAVYADQGDTEWLHDDEEMYPKRFLLDLARALLREDQPELQLLSPSSVSALIESLKNSFCTITVGNSEADDGRTETFTVHVNVICKRSKFFAAALSKSWIEHEKHVVKLPESDPDLVRQYLHHAYTGSLYEGTTPWSSSLCMKTDVYPQLAQPYVLGEYLQDKSFKTAVLNAFIDCIRPCHNYTFGCDPHCFSIRTTVNIMYRGTTIGSPGRKLLVDMYACHPDHPEWLADDTGYIDEEFLRDLAVAAPAFANRNKYSAMHHF